MRLKKIELKQQRKSQDTVATMKCFTVFKKTLKEEKVEKHLTPMIGVSQRGFRQDLLLSSGLMPSFFA